MNDAKLTVKYGTFADIDAMLDLNYAIYPKEWHVSSNYVREILTANPSVYRIVKNGDVVKGIYSLFPLSKVNYEKVLTGQLHENELSHSLLNYKEPRSVWLYLISFIVDIHDPDHKCYTKRLLADFPKRLKDFKAKGIDVQEVGGIAISDDGIRLLSNVGFNRSHKSVKIDSQNYPVFRATPKDIIHAIKI